MSFSIWVLFVAASIIPAVSPGPAVLLAISNSVRHGAAATVISGAGNAAGLIVISLAVYSGLGVLLEASAVLFSVIKIAGAAFMIYLGIKTWRDRSVLEEASAPLCSWRRLFGGAFLLALTNPKAFFVQAALLPLFMTSEMGLMDGILLAVTFALICWLNHCFIGVMGAPLRRLLSSPPRLRLFRGGVGASFVCFGLGLAAYAR